MGDVTGNDPRSVAFLVLGAEGTIGRALTDRLASSGKKVLGTTPEADNVSENLIFLDLSEDVTNWHSPEAPAVAFFCAAMTSIADCREKRTESEKINVHHTVLLAQKLVDGGSFVIFLSTNLVYDGLVPFVKATDPICPLTEYGRQKAEAEKQLLSLGTMVSIVRFTKVLGPHMPLFEKWMEDLRNHVPIHPISDMVFAPVSLDFAVEVLLQVAELRLPGIVQVSGEQDITYAQVAYRMAQLLGVSPEDLVQPITAAEANLQLEALPKHTTLDTSRLKMSLDISPPPVWTTIDQFLRYDHEK